MCTIQDTNKVYFDVPTITITVDHMDDPSQYNSSSYLCDLPILPPLFPWYRDPCLSLSLFMVVISCQASHMEISRAHYHHTTTC